MTPEPSLRDKLLARVINTGISIMEGYEMPFIDEMIRHYGPGNLMRFMTAGSELMKVLIPRYGEGHSQFLIGISGLIVGCEYCAYGHPYGGNLYYFRDTGRLSPLSEREIPRLMRQRDSETRDELDKAFSDDADFARLRTLVGRMYELRLDGVAPETEDDGLLLDLRDIWTFMNECSVLHDARPNPTCSIAKDLELVQRYNLARDAQEKGEWVQPEASVDPRW